MTTAGPATAIDARGLPFGGRESRSPGRWGMILVIATEASFFAYLLFAYFYLQSMANGWPPDGPPPLRVALPNTALLVASSGAMWWAEASARRGAQGALRLGLLLTFAMGATFLAFQGVEWSRSAFGLTRGVYSSAFYFITGFHGMHVAAGLLMIAVAEARALAGHFDARHHLAVSNTALYWHFVDAVWLVVFSSLYLAPRLV
ncbi:hypothetical protein tb265_48160 [Gemmatimonadetes bacterium T265]|nr:hypothetical protein tb265_48160 [Gemmatimonadetes bacterium T265]